MSNEYGRLPDFIIGGAMKSATTSLHHLLAQHPQIFIPDGEVNFFSLDDTDENRAYVCGGQRVVFDLDGERDRYMRWYGDHFSEAGEGQMIGEDSTVYLPSRRAAERVAREMPEVKWIFLLRDPVARAYSHYWHTIGAGLGMYDFERTLTWAPGRILARSYYRRQLEVYYDLFPRENILVLFFEEFVKDIEGQTGQAVEFLGLPAMESINRRDSKKNMGSRPISLPFRRFHNRLLRNARLPIYPPDFPAVGDPSTGAWPKLAQLTHRALNRFTLSSRRYPQMKPATRAYLETLFRQENRGLSELIQRDVTTVWPYMAD